MSRPQTLLIVAGTRPEIIKQAPLQFAAAAHARWRARFCFTGQHRDMGQQAFAELGFVPDASLDLMQPGQTPDGFLGLAVPAIASLIRGQRPDWVAVQGDTTTALAGALAAFYERIPVIHIEAGLRTYQAALPFPEEIHRQLITRLATAHAAPTARCQQALLRELVPAANIYLSGNPGIDSLLRIVALPAGSVAPLLAELSARIAGRRLVLITMHRRESFGDIMHGMCHAIRRLADRFPDTAFLLPVHHNPAVQAIVHAELSASANIILTAPLGYAAFSKLLAGAYLVLTDSGGIQEEAPALGIPVLVLRDVTERPEAVESGGAILVGCAEDRIHDHAFRLLSDPVAHARMAVPRFPYGDGHAATRTLDWLATRPPAPPELRAP